MDKLRFVVLTICLVISMIVLPDGGTALSVMTGPPSGAVGTLANGDCFVSLHGSLQIDASHALDQVKMTVTDDCRVATLRLTSSTKSSGAGGKAASPLASTHRACLAENWTTDSGLNTAEYLQTWNDFYWDGSNVQDGAWGSGTADACCGYSHGTVYTAHSLGSNLLPSWWYWWDNTVDFNNVIGNVATKENKLWGYGNGQCYLEYWHNGFVPRGGFVTATLSYYN